MLLILFKPSPTCLYVLSASTGLNLPGQVSLLVKIINTSTFLSFSEAQVIGRAQSVQLLHTYTGQEVR